MADAKSPISLSEIEAALDEAGIKPKIKFLNKTSNELKRATNKTIAQLFVEYGLSREYPLETTDRESFATSLKILFNMNDVESSLRKRLSPLLSPFFTAHGTVRLLFAHSLRRYFIETRK